MSGKKRTLVWATGSAALAAALSAIAAMIFFMPVGGAVDMEGHRVQLDPGTVPSATVQAQMHAVPDVGGRFTVSSVGLDVPLGELSVADDNITPPGFTSVYLVRNLGTSLAKPTAGTVFVVTHSIRGGGTAPGNYLFDLKTGTSRLRPGAAITVGSVSYTVTGSTTEAKNHLPQDATVWANTPGRLVVITCLEKPSGAPSTENLIITATRNNVP